MHSLDPVYRYLLAFRLELNRLHRPRLLALRLSLLTDRRVVAALLHLCRAPLLARALSLARLRALTSISF